MIGWFLFGFFGWTLITSINPSKSDNPSKSYALGPNNSLAQRRRGHSQNYVFNSEGYDSVGYALGAGASPMATPGSY